MLVRFLDFMVNRTGQLHMQVEITRIIRVVKYLEDVDACSLPDAEAKVMSKACTIMGGFMEQGGTHLCNKKNMGGYFWWVGLLVVIS